MASYTTLVNVDAEAATKVSSFVAKLIPTGGEAFLSECQSAITSRNTADLIKKILEQQEVVFAMDNDSGKIMFNSDQLTQRQMQY